VVPEHPDLAAPLVVRFTNTLTIRPSRHQRPSIQTGPDLRSSLRFP
jgi:hypothetical protein